MHGHLPVHRHACVRFIKNNLCTKTWVFKVVLVQIPRKSSQVFCKTSALSTQKIFVYGVGVEYSPAGELSFIGWGRNNNRDART